jgi:hypothetical protein
MKYFSLFTIPLLSFTLFAQSIPNSYSNLSYDSGGNLQLELNDNTKLTFKPKDTFLTLDNLMGNPKGSKKGIKFNFNNEKFKGTIYYGFIPYKDTKYPKPVFFKRVAKIKNGEAEVEISQMAGKYDMIGWQKSGKGTLGYRVVDHKGNMLYDGVVSFTGNGPFTVAVTLTDGPFVNNLTDQSVIISFNTNKIADVLVEVNSKTYQSIGKKNHELKIEGLTANTKYKYKVIFGKNQLEYGFKTAPKPGSKTKFTFAYASDSRGGNGGGERDIFGANAYIVDRILAVSNYRKSSFLQFTGDLISGYRTNTGTIDLEYANWKRVVQPYAAYMPVIATMGNHEALMYQTKDGDGTRYSIDRFPYDTESSEALFAKNFVNPLNGPESEDGSIYDPSKTTIDFPSYKENVFYYTYDNIAVVVLNSNYWYAPSTNKIPVTSGNLHGYIMDNQLKWMEETIQKLESNNHIDHIFITEHTPFFPNGGHVQDDMWYNGNNKYRPYINGKPVKNGIIQRRDELLDIIVNKSQKVAAILTGDEHNYCRTEIGPETNIYPEVYQYPKLKLNRTVYQINNGAAGAPYYAQEQTPWTPFASGFTTQNAVALFHIDGAKIELEVINPLTFEELDRFIIRK